MRDIIIENKISEIKSNHDVNCILQVGNINGRDIDLFVFIDEESEFLREVKQINGLYFDISYMSINLLKQGIFEKWAFLVNSLQNFQVLYKKNNDIFLIINEIKKIKPDKLSEMEINYYRFLFFEKLEVLSKNRKDRVNALFLSNSILKDIIIFYFKVKQKVIPKDKKMLEILSKDDEKLGKLCYDFILENKIDKKINILHLFIYEILKPYGGLLSEWNKGRFPLK